ncbi:hypothetical protein EGW08_023295 [Elysia chlorotica]|uniref:ZP domain-containing protein n=1 Tax=Elysia chlorotica TaxID=188477 RepID=A0A433SIW4_ELYCH|nr:hypothetical protein EGW08_023295 [Elysia chlorotica]
MERTEISLSPTYFWLVIMLREAIGAATFQTVNMHDHSVCSTKNPYIVTENLGYKVQLKSPTKDSALHSCSVTFRAGNNNLTAINLHKDLLKYCIHPLLLTNFFMQFVCFYHSERYMSLRCY